MSRERSAVVTPGVFTRMKLGQTSLYAATGACTPLAASRRNYAGSIAAWRIWPRLKGAIRWLVTMTVSPAAVTSTAVGP